MPPLSLMHSNRLLVGRILKPIGVNGLVKIQSFMSVSSDFLRYRAFYSKSNVLIEIKNLCHIGDDKFSGFLCKKDGNILSTNEIQEYRLMDLYLDKNSLPPLSKNEYYFEDLKGLDIRDINGVSIGKVRSAFDYGAGTFLEVILDNGKVATLPFNKHSVIEVETAIVIDRNYLLF